MWLGSRRGRDMADNKPSIIAKRDLERRDAPWIMLLAPNPWGRYPRVLGSLWMADALSKHANVLTVFIPTSRSRVRISRFLGRIYWKNRRLGFVSTLMRNFLTSKLPRKLSIVKPEDIDMVLVWAQLLIPPESLKAFRNALKVYYSIDSIYPPTFHAEVCVGKVHEYDVVLVAHRRSIDMFREFGAEEVHLFPFFCVPTIHRRLRLEKIYDACFIGDLSAKTRWGETRKEFFDRLAARMPNRRFYIGRAYLHDMSRIFASSKIVLNVSRIGEVNARVFETLGCGSFLLTEYSEEIHDYFDVGKDLVTYRGGDLRELSELVDYYSENEEERERIAESGYRKCISKHTVYHRARFLLEEILGHNLKSW